MGGGAQSDAASHPEDSLVLVGAYDHPELLAHTPKSGAPIKSGVHVVLLEGRTGKLRHISTSAIGPNIAFLIRCPMNPSLLYASTERIDDEGEILTLRLTEDLRLEEISRVRAGGRSTCYLNFNRDRTWMMAVNYWDAKVSLLQLDNEGRPCSPSSVLMQPEARYVDEAKPNREEHWKYRQRWPHSHCCVTEPYTSTLHFVVDLGLDKVFIYRVNSAEGCMVPKGSVQLPRGKGPRHIVFHPTLRMAYLVNELDSTVSTFRVNIRDEWGAGSWGEPTHVEEDCQSAGAALEMVQCMSSLPVEEQGKTTISPQGIWKAASHSSEIRLHPNGRYLYIANRGHDSIAVYAVHQTTGELDLAEIVPSGGECPRNFNFTPRGELLIVGNQNSNRLCTFRIDQESGKLNLLDTANNICSPNYIYPLPFASVSTAGLVENALPSMVQDAVPVPAHGHGMTRVPSASMIA